MLDGMIDLRLAPMAAVTNTPFRLIARECGAGRLTSEEIDARGLVEGSARTAELASFLPEEHPIAESEGVDAITVHPRTRSQQYSGRAPWEIIAGVVDAVAIPVIGNGDVQSPADAEAMVAATRCAAVMVGRGALGAPWIFRGSQVPREDRARIIRRHDALIEALLPPRTAAIQLKKHLAWYASGFPGAA